jgi:aspartyl-tRNA(Asn)/glutamyl-tRNA(Gln) amidotransferase subunit C
VASPPLWSGFDPRQQEKKLSLDPATVRRIAKLARIRVEENQLPQLQAELNGILGWIEQLNEVNLDGVEPLTGATQMALRLRADVVNDGGIAEQVLVNAPDRAGDFYAVPKVVE